MKYISKIISCMMLLISASQYAQHHSVIEVTVSPENKTLVVKQRLTFYNQSADTLATIVLNDWNNAYSSKTTPLARRFSDEFVRSFHVAKEEERGNTNNVTIEDVQSRKLEWNRLYDQPDLIQLSLPNGLLPNQKETFTIQYTIKVPSDRFTNYGYDENGDLYLKNWFLTPARYENGGFIKYSNNNLDDIANATSDFDLTVNVPQSYEVITDLFATKSTENSTNVYKLSGKNRTDFSLYVKRNSDFHSFKKQDIEVITDLKSDNLEDVEQALLINQMLDFVKENIGQFPLESLLFRKQITKETLSMG